MRQRACFCPLSAFFQHLVGIVCPTIPRKRKMSAKKSASQKFFLKIWYNIFSTLKKWDYLFLLRIHPHAPKCTPTCTHMHAHAYKGKALWTHYTCFFLGTTTPETHFFVVKWIFLFVIGLKAVSLPSVCLGSKLFFEIRSVMLDLLIETWEISKSCKVGMTVHAYSVGWFIHFCNLGFSRPLSAKWHSQCHASFFV